jgi:hypothetical protein
LDTGFPLQPEGTARVVLPEIFPEIITEVAVMLAEPGEKAVARPLLLLTVATNVFEEVQATCVVIS